MPGAQEPITSIQVLTDRLDPIESAIVQVDGGANPSILVTNADGQSPWVAIDTSSGFDLVLADRALPSGQALGLVEHMPAFFAVDPGADLVETTISRTQPLATSVLVDGLPGQTNTLFPPDGGYPFWRVIVPQGSSLLFSMSVAALLDRNVIEEYLEYRGVLPSHTYVRGVACLVPHVNLGQHGLVVGIKLLGDLPGGCAVDTYNLFHHTKTAIPGPPLQASVLLVERDVAYVWVRGTLEAGNLALLLREPGDPGQVTSEEDAPPSLVVPPDAGEGIEFARLQTAQAEDSPTALAFEPCSFGDCLPPEPGPPSGWDCDPEPPDPDANCQGPPAPGPRPCRVVKQRTPVICRGAGSVIRGQKVKTVKWKVSFSTQATALVGGGTLQSGGGFEYGQESSEVWTDEWTPLGPTGQCKRYYIYTLVCLQDFSTPMDAYVYVDDLLTLLPCAGIHTTGSCCTDSIYTDSTCAR